MNLDYTGKEMRSTRTRSQNKDSKVLDLVMLVDIPVDNSPMTFNDAWFHQEMKLKKNGGRLLKRSWLTW